jgi:enoyl-CoA hydratase/carnithine racemase
VTAVPTWSAESGLITAEHVDGVVVIAINRPDKLNALTAVMKKDLASAVRHFGDGREALGVVVTGSASTFCAGQDLDEMRRPDADVNEAIELFHDLTRAVLQTNVPTIAALAGPVVGGAAEWTLCFDLRISTPDCYYLLPERRLGLPISNASSLLLFQLLKAGAAMRMVLDGRRIDATEAQQSGLIDEIVEPERLVETAVGTILGWCGDDRVPPTVHLKLLRPDLRQVEEAMERETVASRALGSIEES